MDLNALRSRIEGIVTTSTDAGYEELRCGMIWNRLTPSRYPQVVVQVANEHDVVEAVRFACAENLKVSWCGAGDILGGVPLCDGSLLD
ncbi:MAG: hypothetical protein R3B95_06510 [Nitrospirales bacterium]|nr:hypothetical protein [Nitrospirales bacterium]